MNPMSTDNNSKLIESPLQGLDLVSSFTAARILFPHDPINKTCLRRVQRLCQLDRLESYQIGRRYLIVKQSVYDYLQENHHRNSNATSD
jgi:hypothetical protein